MHSWSWSAQHAAGSSLCRACLLLTAVLGLLFAGQTASGAVYTWSNVGTDWGTASNWGGILPGSTDVGLFNLSGYTSQPNVGEPCLIGGLWGMGSGSVAVGGGNTLILYGTTINSNTGTGIELDPGAGALTISAPLSLLAAQQWLNNSGNLLTVSGSVANGGNTLTYAGSGNATIGGAASSLGLSGAGGLIMNGTGLLQLAGSGITYTGNTTVTSGTLQFYNARNFSNATGNDSVVNTMSIASGAVLEMYADNTTASGDGSNQILGSTTSPGTTITGAGIFRKTGNGILASSGNGSGRLVFAMSAGGLIDIENGDLRNGGWSATTWTNNKASMYIGPNGQLDIWDGNEIFIDALNGPGLVSKFQGQGNVTLEVGVAGGSGTFSGSIQSPQSGTPFGNNTAGSQVSLTKVGAGIEVLSGSNSYNNTTTIMPARCRSATSATPARWAAGAE